VRRLLPLLAVAVLVGAGWLVVQHLDNGGAAATVAGPLVRPVAAQGPYKVRHVTDGDTIDVLIGRTSTAIRLLGIDTPETKKPNVAV
jgi:endonuclease YncB( thermonuclease family)